MEDNFRLLQDDPNRVFYVSKTGLAGSASSAYYGSRLNPLPGVAEFCAHTPSGSVGVVGTGQYQWATSFANGTYGADSHELLADGYVCIRGDGHTRQAAFANSGFRCTGFTFEQFGGFNFRAYQYGNPVYYAQCVFKVLPEYADQPNSYAASIATFEDCVFVNVNFAGSPATLFTRCLFFNCTGDGLGSLSQCYLDATSALTTATATGCNVDPAADPTAGYGLNVGGAGLARRSPQGLSADPLFNALAYDDFSVRAGSPHLAADIGPRQYRQATSFVVRAPAAGQAADATNTSFAPVGGGSPVDLLSTTGMLEGTEAGALAIRPAASLDGLARLRTDRIRHSAGLPRELSYLQVLGGNNFDTSYPALESQLNPNAPEVFNNNVPDLGTYPAGAAGRNPNRLRYGLRWSILPDPRLDHPEDWATGADLVECEWNTRPLYNPVTNIGNGRPDFVVAEGRPVICTWYQLEVGLSNVYYH